MKIVAWDAGMSIKCALKELLNNLDKVEEKHNQIHDTAVRELLIDTVMDYFVFGESLEEHPLDNYFAMLSDEGDQEVHEALSQFLSHPEVKLGPVELTTPAEHLAAYQKRLDIFQDSEVQSAKGHTYDWYFGWVERIMPSKYIYPNLFQVTDLGIPSMRAHFVSRLTPSEHLISNINCVPFVGDQCVIITLDNGNIEMPGGTLEPGDDYETALRRELNEEAGARLLNYRPLGAWFTESSLPEPFRPHLPHPKAYRYVVYANVSLDHKPTNVGEQVAKVEAVSVDEAAARFITAGRPDLAELYQLAAEVRKQHNAY